MGETKGSSGGFLSRRKFAIFCGLVTFIVLCYVLKEKYFYASDCLKPVASSPRFNVFVNKVKDARNAVLSHLPWGSSDDVTGKTVTIEKNVWEVWIEKNPHLSSIGDIYDRCDNATRTKIGKVVLEMSNKYGGVHVTSYMNITYNHDIKSSTAHLEVKYEGELLYEKDYDMCEAALKLDTPYTCPIPKGKLLVVRDVARMPGYIPKGTYKISAYVKDQDASEIGCTFAEFKTGEKPT